MKAVIIMFNDKIAMQIFPQMKWEHSSLCYVHICGCTLSVASKNVSMS